MIQYIRVSKLSYLYLLVESVLNLVHFFSRKLITFYIQLLYKVRYFVNNGRNLFLELLTNGLSSIHLKWPKEEVDISKWFISFEWPKEEVDIVNPSLILQKKKKYKTLIRKM